MYQYWNTQEVISYGISEVIKNVRLEPILFQEEAARELYMGYTSVNRWKNEKIKTQSECKTRFGRTLQKKNLK